MKWYPSVKEGKISMIKLTPDTGRNNEEILNIIEKQELEMKDEYNNRIATLEPSNRMWDNFSSEFINTLYKFKSLPNYIFSNASVLKSAEEKKLI
uniref:DNA-directed DNA polymerase n=1 Tax=Rhabditophanes sp. KR3021 TaxID=114890 RepID=A0AC35TT79_9BILA